MQDELHLYMVFDLCVNGDLADYCGEHRPLQPGERARTVFAELVDALTFLHSRDIVHRDIKPENVFFDARWHAVLGDFGCAKRLDRSSESGHRVRALSFVGSVGYVPPELLGHADGSDTSGVGLRADIFALGATAQVMCTGTPPFLHSDSSEFEVLSRVRHGKRRKPRAKLTDPDLLEVLDAMLHHHASSRPPARRLALFRYFRGCQWPPDRGAMLEPLVAGDTVDSVAATPARALSLTDSLGALESQAALQQRMAAALLPDDVLSYVSEDARVEQQKSSVWAPFLRLREGETILATALIMRLRNEAYFYLILTSDERLLLVRPEPRILKLSVYVDQVPKFEMTPPPADVPGAVATLTLRLVNDDSEKTYAVFAASPMEITDQFDALVGERHRRGNLRSSLRSSSVSVPNPVASTNIASPLGAGGGTGGTGGSSGGGGGAPMADGSASIGRIHEQIASDATTLLDKFRAEFDLTARDLCTEPHVLVIGCTGSGKSTLINNVFGRQVARVGGGVPVTQHFDRYELESESVVIYDSKGLEVGEHTNFLSTTRDFLASPDVEVHVVWYIINSAVSRIQPFEIEVCSQLFSKLPIIFIMNKADLSTPDERDSLRRSIMDIRVANCVAVLETACAPTRSTSELPSACSKCGSDDIEFKPKRKLVCCADCGHVEQLVLQTGLDVLVSTTMGALPELARERFVSAQQVSMSAKDSAARKIFTDFHDADFLHAHLDRQQFNAVAKMLVRLSTVWEFREHSREYATALAREHVGQYSLRDRVFLLMGRQDKRREATLARLTAVGIVWHRCVRSLYTAILQLLAHHRGAPAGAPTDVEALVDTAFQELREEAVERITAQLETESLQHLLDAEIPSTIGQGPLLAAAAATAAAASAPVSRNDSRELSVEDRRGRVSQVRSSDASRDASRSVSPDALARSGVDSGLSPVPGEVETLRKSSSHAGTRRPSSPKPHPPLNRKSSGESGDETASRSGMPRSHSRPRELDLLSSPDDDAAHRSTHRRREPDDAAPVDRPSSAAGHHHGSGSGRGHHRHTSTAHHQSERESHSRPTSALGNADEVDADGRRSAQRHRHTLSNEDDDASQRHSRHHRHRQAAADVLDFSAGNDESTVAEVVDLRKSSHTVPRVDESGAVEHVARRKTEHHHHHHHHHADRAALSESRRSSASAHHDTRRSTTTMVADDESSESEYSERSRHRRREDSSGNLVDAARHRSHRDERPESATGGEPVSSSSSRRHHRRADDDASSERHRSRRDESMSGRRASIDVSVEHCAAEPTSRPHRDGLLDSASGRRRHDSHRPDASAAESAADESASLRRRSRRGDDERSSSSRRGNGGGTDESDGEARSALLVRRPEPKTPRSSSRRTDGTDESDAEKRASLRRGGEGSSQGSGRRDEATDDSDADKRASLRRRSREPTAAVAAAQADGAGSSPTRALSIRRPSLQLQERQRADDEDEDEVIIVPSTPRRRHAQAARASDRSVFTASSDVTELSESR
jgi:GTP-binding protein EngB required for normal cell division